MKKKVLRIGLHSPVLDLKPREVQDYVTILVVSQIFEAPYFYPGRAAKTAGAMPEIESVIFREPLSRHRAGDDSVLAARIRQELRFSDGTALNAGHVAASLQKVEQLRQHAEIDSQGDRVLFRLTNQNPRFSLLLTHYYCAVTLKKNGVLLGTGPFQFGESLPGGGARLVKNPHYRKAVAIDEIEFRIYPLDADGQAKALAAALTAGELDFTNELPRDDAAKLKRVAKKFEPGNSTCILFMNSERSTLKQPELRRAIALAVDRHRITEASYNRPLAYTASSVLPPELGNARDDLKHDLGKAKEVLAQMDGSPPQSLSLFAIAGSRPYLPHPEKTMKILAEQIGELGIQLDLKHASSLDEFYTVTDRGNYDLLLAGWITDTPDVTDFLDGLLASWNVPNPGKPRANCANFSRWASDEMDEAMRNLRVTGTAKEVQKILRLLSRDVPFCPLMYGATFVVHSFRVKSYEISPLGIPIFADLDLAL